MALNTVIADVATAMLNIADQALQHAGCDPVAHKITHPGTVTWDGDLCDGILAVTWSLLRSTHNFPIPDSILETRDVAPTFMVDYRVAIVRCWPTVDSRGHAPSDAAMIAHGANVGLDQYAVWRGLVCGLEQLCAVPQATTADPALMFQVGSSTIVGPEGGGVSSETAVTMGIIDDCPCDEFLLGLSLIAPGELV